MDASSDLGLLTPPLISLVQGELDPGERITWVAQPNPRRAALQSVFVVLFGIAWTAFSLYWIAGASGFKMPTFERGFDFFPLFGVPFVLVGFGMLAAPFWMVRLVKKTVYVLTDRRAIVFQGGWTRTASVQSYGPTALGALRRKQRADGSGDLIFEGVGAYDSDTARTRTAVGFFAIAQVKQVEELVRQLSANKAESS